MIKSVGIQNFLSHEETFVEFHKGFNVIAGVSDSGKSTVLRAIDWVSRNQLSGDALKSWSAKKKDSVMVEMVLENPVTGAEEVVTKERMGSTSSYTVSGYPEPFSVVGRHVPKEAQDIINFSELNFKSQHDPYLLPPQMTAGSLAKMINELVGLSDIDVSLKNLNSKIMGLKGSAEKTTADISQTETEIQQFSYLETMGCEIQEVETGQASLSALNLNIERLTKIIEDISSITIEIEDNKSILTLVPVVAGINTLIQDLESKDSKILSVGQTVTNIENLKISIDSKKAILKAVQPAQAINTLVESFKEKDKKISSLSNSIDGLLKISESWENEKQLLIANKPCQEIVFLIAELQVKTKQQEKIAALVNSVCQTEKQAKESSLVVSRQRLALKAFLTKTNLCPECLRPLDEHTINAMVGKR